MQSVLSHGTKRTHEKAAGLIVISESRLNKICGNWITNKINLLRSPPSSGKTTLAKVLEGHFKSQRFIVKYITFAHWHRDEFPDLLHNNKTFDAFWRKEVQCTWSECANSNDPIFVLIDEAQILYDGDGTLAFWNDMKYYTDHPKDGLHVLLLCMYEDRNPGSAILKDNYTP
ncbi:9903_t:CDS:1, partial [Ambispora leptoticha]